MISPSYFVSAGHWHPAVGDTFRFYHTNGPNGLYEDRVVLSGQNIGSGDLWLGKLWLGKLSTPVSAAAAKYPVLRLPADADYVHLPLYVFGRPSDDNNGSPTKMHMGISQISDVHTVYGGYLEYSWYDSSSYPTKAKWAEGGDSGGSSFVISNGVPTVIGIHLRYREFIHSRSNHRVEHRDGWQRRAGHCTDHLCRANTTGAIDARKRELDRGGRRRLGQRD
jgi:hypothetical protein